MSRTISILGCGWLGLPLAKYLIAQGYAVKGTTTTVEKMTALAGQGIQPYLIAFNPMPQGENLTNFLDADILLINIPPQARKGADFHTTQINSLVQFLPLSQKTIYISSTSVYPENNQIATEISPTIANHVLIRAENSLQIHLGKQLTVLRAGGLMGYDRIPAKYFAGKKGLTTGDIPVNFVHRDDVIGIIAAVITQNRFGELYNVVAPQHPKREELYRRNCADFGYEQPEFVENPHPSYKIVSSERLICDLGYTFVYPNPLAFRYQRVY